MMKLNHSVRTILLIWLAWAVIIIGFQQVVTMRLEIKRPDYALQWTVRETARNSQRDKPYLMEPFMNHQVSWDSEFYLSIAVTGYEDPDVRVVQDSAGSEYSLNYAFFPIYPYVTRIVAFPLKMLGLTPIATATLAGVLVSIFGTLGAMLALYDLTREKLGESGGVRVAAYLLLFPTSFFLAQVHTEGLFVGLAFGSLALLHRRKWLLAGVLAALATGTRAVGALLVVPLVMNWLLRLWEQHLSWNRTTLLNGLFMLSPLVAYGIWYLVLGEPFHFVEDNFFSRHLFAIPQSLEAWRRGLDSMQGNSQATIYYSLELLATVLGLGACLVTFRRYPAIAMFGFLVILVSFTSGVAQGMPRYVLTVPSLFIFLGQLGKHQAFDRSWSLGSILLMGMLATLFSFDMWVS